MSIVATNIPTRSCHAFSHGMLHGLDFYELTRSYLQWAAPFVVPAGFAIVSRMPCKLFSRTLLWHDFDKACNSSLRGCRSSCIDSRNVRVQRHWAAATCSSSLGLRTKFISNDIPPSSAIFHGKNILDLFCCVYACIILDIWPMCRNRFRKSFKYEVFISFDNVTVPFTYVTLLTLKMCLERND